MDPKKQNLTPELKQIYDRVMNTQVAGKIPAGPNPASTTNMPGQTAPAAPISDTPSSVQSQPSQTAPSTPTQQGFAPISSGQPFLSSVPPRPVADTKQFSFTGKKIEAPNLTIRGSHVQLNGGKKISGKIIAVLVGFLIILWSVFWAKFFGLF